MCACVRLGLREQNGWEVKGKKENEKNQEKEEEK